MYDISDQCSDSAETIYAARRARLVGYILFSTAFFIGFFNRFSPAIFANKIANDLGIDATALGALASTHFWVYTSMQIPAGIVIDRFGIRQPVFIGTATTGLGALILGLAPTYLLALAGPAMVGFGMSLVFVGVMKNNSLWFDARRFGLVTGITMLIGAMGSIAAEAPASLLLNLLDWRTIFVGLGLATLLIAVFILWLYSEPHEVPAGNIIAGNPRDHKSAHNIDWRVIRSKQLWRILLAIAGTNGTFYAFAGLWGGPILTDGFGVPRSHAALLVTASLVPYGIASLFVGHASDRLGTRKFFVVASSLLNALAWGWLAFGTWSPGWSGTLLYLALGLSSAQVVVSFAAVKESVAPSTAGIALAVVNMGVFLTSAVIQVGFGWILDTAVDAHAAPTLAAYRTALVLPVCFSLIGLCAALRVRETFTTTETRLPRLD